MTDQPDRTVQDEEMFEQHLAAMNTERKPSQHRLVVYWERLAFFAALHLERTRVAAICDRIEALLTGHLWNANDDSDDDVIDNVLELVKELRTK